jgi:hypothetical protein
LRDPINSPAHHGNGRRRPLRRVLCILPWLASGLAAAQTSAAPPNAPPNAPSAMLVAATQPQTSQTQTAQTQSALPQSAQTQSAQTATPGPKSPQTPFDTGSLTGTVIDADANVMAGVDVALMREASNAITRTTTDDNGVFRFASVPPGKFHLTATAKGMAPASVYGILKQGENLQTLPFRLQAGAANSSVDVFASQEELAEAEIHVEEQQRLLGIMPNFFTSYDWHAPPLTSRQKFQLAWKNVIDPGSFFVTAVAAGIQQAQNSFPGYNQGVAGYARRYGAATGDLVSGTYLGGAILPSLFHQDPRYFYKGTGTIKARTLYAISRAFLCRGDNGKTQVNFSGILGDMSAGALANLYYPPGSRNGAALTFEEGGLNILGDAAGNIVQEFLLKHLTRHAPSYPATPAPPRPATTTAATDAPPAESQTPDVPAIQPSATRP